MVIAMVKAPNVLEKYDLGTISNITVGAAPLTEETATKLRELRPSWAIVQGYGMPNLFIFQFLTRSLQHQPAA